MASKAAKSEIWVDESNNGNWVKVYEYIDSGGLGREGVQCGGSPDQIINWGGPVATFRWDEAGDVDFKNLSVREISPVPGAATSVPAGTPVTPAPQPTVPTPPPAPSFVSISGDRKPSAAATGSNVFLVWETYHSPPEITFRKSSDGGTTYDEPITISGTTGNSRDPDIAVSGSNVYAVYSESVIPTDGQGRSVGSEYIRNCPIWYGNKRVPD